MELWKKSELIKILKENNLWAKKRFGQNFLINKGILDKIVKTSQVNKNDLVVEIGPGLGVLTHELCKIAKKVISVEIDYNMIDILKGNLAEFPNLEIENNNALNYVPPSTNYKVVANIPYNITSPLISHFLQSQNPPESLTLLIQKEVAEKICDKTINSILNLQVRLFADSKKIKIVKPHSFYPAPKVESTIIKIIPYKKENPLYSSLDFAQKVLKIAKIAFTQKRKTLHNSLKKHYSIDNSKFKQKRPHELSIEDWKSFVLSLNA
ncbi:16S rRNA (adenine(1518)-N(6)/adenine(1519)-N(6))-dimethyltransferase RsmA [Patescibacteria group bacterium]